MNNLYPKGHEKVTNKRVFMFYVILILFVSLVSAKYECSYGDIDSNQRELKIGDKKVLNGVGIALISSDETMAFNRFSADLFIDAERLTLNNETSSLLFDLISGEQNVTLINSTDNSANIKLNSDTDSVNEDESIGIASMHAFLVSSQGIYPGEATVELIIGEDEVALSSDDNPDEIVTIDDVKYSLELFSASDDNAIIILSKCENESATLVKISEPVVDNPVVEDTNTSINETIIVLNNVTVQNETVDNNISTNTTQNGTLNIGYVAPEEKEDVDEGVYTKVIIGGISTLILIIIITIIYLRKSKDVVNTTTPTQTILTQPVDDTKVD